MHTICKMSDGTIMSGPPEILDIIEGIRSKKQEMWKSAKFKEDEVVKIKDDISSLTRCFQFVYNYTDARMIANEIRGKLANVISVDELSDKNVLGIYYSVEMQDTGIWYVIPEDLLEKVNF